MSQNFTVVQKENIKWFDFWKCHIKLGTLKILFSVEVNIRLTIILEKFHKYNIFDKLYIYIDYKQAYDGTNIGQLIEIIKEPGIPRKFKVCKPVDHHTFQINQPTRCNYSSSLLLDIYVQLNMIRASSCTSSGAQQLQ